MNARGVMVLNAARFLEATYGPDAHRRVVDALPPAHRGTFLSPIREASWEPVEDFVAYLETARRLLAPGDPEFFHALGFYAGDVERRETGFGVMVGGPERTVALGAKAFRSMWDTGTAVVRAAGPRACTAFITGLPPVRCLCERNMGAFEGVLATDALRCTVRESLCLSRGDAHCALRIEWTDRTP